MPGRDTTLLIVWSDMRIYSKSTIFSYTSIDLELEANLSLLEKEVDWAQCISDSINSGESFEKENWWKKIHLPDPLFPHRRVSGLEFRCTSVQRRSYSYGRDALAVRHAAVSAIEGLARVLCARHPSLSTRNSKSSMNRFQLTWLTPYVYHCSIKSFSCRL